MSLCLIVFFAAITGSRRNIFEMKWAVHGQDWNLWLKFSRPCIFIVSYTKICTFCNLFGVKKKRLIMQRNVRWLPIFFALSLISVRLFLYIVLVIVSEYPVTFLIVTSTIIFFEHIYLRTEKFLTFVHKIVCFAKRCHKIGLSLQKIICMYLLIISFF